MITLTIILTILAVILGLAVAISPLLTAIYTMKIHEEVQQIKFLINKK